MKINIVKGEVYIVSPFNESIFGVFIGTSILNVDIKEYTCTCWAWEMSGIPCEHACAVIEFHGQNVADFVDDQLNHYILWGYYHVILGVLLEHTRGTIWYYHN